ncbi:antitoxin Xre/MbcA/ParS toxin-binding domain-containing protein [Algoriphagus sp. D3-2-R+10]|uniref:antitoxin Xre/MbcA/ParS toxin-binding domain-containing protein n=1 Tax=Algoriphagus aurantiacus TaxID=3103948 RepID=UPI002B3920F0|nr:antitoxin Xre/MbcA/ParS toxin-binding domain-containing protein [Algoriphagus sp. D3-2-R+10]MEB2774769.1 antitoxin Xre/MbcA/ParS toxin-binding domain-containing protein [Algoriphagus sp. D3-2-R+10]
MTHTWKISFGEAGVESIHTGSDSYYFFQEAISMVSEPMESYEVAVSFHDTGELFDFLDFTQQDVSEMLEVDPSTLSRWRKEDRKLTKMLTKSILEIDQVIAKGIRIFGTEELLSQWLHTQNTSLGDQKPAALLKNPYGIDRVDEAMEAMSWGSIL